MVSNECHTLWHEFLQHTCDGLCGSEIWHNLELLKRRFFRTVCKGFPRQVNQGRKTYPKCVNRIKRWKWAEHQHLSLSASWLWCLKLLPLTMPSLPWWTVPLNLHSLKLHWSGDFYPSHRRSRKYSPLESKVSKACTAHTVMCWLFILQLPSSIYEVPCSHQNHVNHCKPKFWAQFFLSFLPPHKPVISSCLLPGKALAFPPGSSYPFKSSFPLSHAQGLALQPPDLGLSIPRFTDHPQQTVWKETTGRILDSEFALSGHKQSPPLAILSYVSG